MKQMNMLWQNTERWTKSECKYEDTSKLNREKVTRGFFPTILFVLT